MQVTTNFKLKSIAPEQLFMLSVLIVNGGNYLYNLLLGRLLGPSQFADAAVLITFLLVLSFVAMTFQLATAKFSVVLQSNVLQNFFSKVYKYATIIGISFGLLIIVFAKQLQLLFNTSTSSMFTIFGIGVPIYFLMSVNRGFYQGKKDYKSLSVTYQLEMLSRLLITLGLIFVLNIQSSVVIAIGILLSFGFGLVPFKSKYFTFKKVEILDQKLSKQVIRFFVITAFYELTQIIINNSDILLVKHYFDSYQAGLYASLALIGRIVYFIAWMFVMLLLPEVVQLKKDGKSTAPILFKYIMYIAIIASVIIIACALFPKLAILMLFGDSYLAIAPLLWKYALATGLFAISNIFAYYYLSLDKYIPVILSAIFGILQVVLIVIYHSNLQEVVYMQIITMVLLLIVQVTFFFTDQEIKDKYQKQNL
ncbi:Capsular polysaccharide biosynthesis protein [Mesoflavibacter sp. HG96]|uniref:oligosaccharide flippase family protein n=1 Tax=Mesoflavibacter TaxID=444051 RepID=UPI000D10706E|nr:MULTISPECIES: oligosaccharide flippase family protein [Mesoflavibacter]QIJ88554.1 Capsular polysaccharide biosynthesis protein [Mesoflavibacter sp. HG96]QIJ91282.1 Capsular polysaccharide biosynthesis protein [Mesoflavibacter sp. HG37]